MSFKTKSNCNLNKYMIMLFQIPFDLAGDAHTDCFFFFFWKSTTQTTNPHTSTEVLSVNKRTQWCCFQCWLPFLPYLSNIDFKRGILCPDADRTAVFKVHTALPVWDQSQALPHHKHYQHILWQYLQNGDSSQGSLPFPVTDIITFKITTGVSV